MIIHTLPTGDNIYKYQRSIVVPFNGKRRVLSTSMLNGGLRDDLTAVINHDVNPGIGRTCEYCGANGEELTNTHISKSLGLDSSTVTHMATIVSMDSASIVEKVYDELIVTAVVTASLEVNGGRVGETATSYEKRGERISLRPGTINIMVFVNADMTPGCSVRAVVTATEAKTAALQELMAGSLYTSGIATGSGTDNVMIIANSESDNQLTYAGKHGKLGELIGKTVMEAVKNSLSKHMNLNEKSQFSVLSRLKRFNVSEKSFVDSYNAHMKEDEGISLYRILGFIHELDTDDVIVRKTTLIVHLMDQYNWGLINKENMMYEAFIILDQIRNHIEGKYNIMQSADDLETLISQKAVREDTWYDTTKGTEIQFIVNNFVNELVRCGISYSSASIIKSC